MFRPLEMVYSGIMISRFSDDRKTMGWKRYTGTAEEICEAILDACWNGRYIAGSGGHFCQFWVRDVGMFAQDFYALGYKDWLRTTLNNAMEIYDQNGHVTTTIFPGRRAADVYEYGTDTLPYLLRIIKALDARDILDRYREFLQKEVKRFFDLVIVRDTGLVRGDRNFSNMRDCINTVSSCYDNCMAAHLSALLDEFGGFDNPFRDYDYEQILKDQFWTGEYFLGDLSGSKAVVGDANVFPFYLDLITDKQMLRSAVQTLQDKRMDQPFPLKYVERRNVFREKFIPLLFTPNYQGDTIWTQLGIIYIGLIKEIDPEMYEKYMGQYRELIEQNGTYLELFHPDGQPYDARNYHADEAMVWAVKYLALARGL